MLRFILKCLNADIWCAGPVFSYKLRYIVGFWLVEMAISTNQKPTIYRNLYENTGTDKQNRDKSGSMAKSKNKMFSVLLNDE